MKVVISGGAGFIGSHLVDYILEEDTADKVIVIDNLSSGRIDFIKHWMGDERFSFHRIDLSSPNSLGDLINGSDIFFHFAADPEVRRGSITPESMWTNNVVATYNALEAARIAKIRFIVFASSSTVYGEPTVMPTPENYSPLEPISIYGASKLACEALISGYAHTFGIRGLILRFANIVGKRLRHGVIYDFIRKLQKNPNKLEILGDGTQRKSYLHVRDAVEATIKLLEHFREKELKTDVFNVGSEDWVTVGEIAEIVSKTMGLQPEYYYTGGVDGGRGWKGDVKYMLLDITKAKKAGWKPKMNSKEAVERAAKEIYEEVKEEPPIN